MLADAFVTCFLPALMSHALFRAANLPHRLMPAAIARAAVILLGSLFGSL